jgi:hypothetical protein
VRIEPREVAPVRLPAPLEELKVRPAVHQAVLVVLDVGARLIGVLRQVQARHPLAAEDVALGDRLRRDVRGRREGVVAQVRYEVGEAGHEDDAGEEDGGRGAEEELDAENHGFSPRVSPGSLRG